MNHYNARTVIVTGGNLPAHWPTLIRDNDLIIGADAGALALVAAGFQADVALGDFDSVTPDELNLIRASSAALNQVDAINKDLTDTELALHAAFRLAPREILLIGGLGGRFDHSLANVHLLAQAASEGFTMTIVDNHNRVRLLRGPGKLTVSKSAQYDHISLLPLSPTATGVSLEGFAYPLNNATLTIGQSLGISNRLLAPTGGVHLSEGMLLVIESHD